MTALYHAYTQTVADGTATSVVRPSDWNSAHVQGQTLSGNTSGFSTVSGTNIVLQGGNNVTLSAVTAANAATIIISGANTVAQTVQTQASGAIAGTGFTSTSTAGTAVVATQGTNGLSMAVPAYITTYVNDLTSGRAGTGFTSTTTAGTAVTAALGTNGLSMAVPAYITTYVNDLTSGRAGTGFTSTTTAGTAITAALGTNGLSMAVPAYITTYVNDLTSGRAGTGTTLALTNLSGTLSVNTNGVALSLNNVDANFAGWELEGVNTAGTTGTTLTTTGQLYLSGGNNITLSGNSNTIVISAGAGGGTTNQTGPNIAVVGSTVTSGTVVFSNSNNVTFGMNGSTITASAAGATLSYYDLYELGNNTVLTSFGQGSIHVQMFVPGENLTMTGVNMLASMSSAASNASMVVGNTFSYGIYSKGSGASTSQLLSMATSSFFINVYASSTANASYAVGNANNSFITNSAGTVINSVMSGMKALQLPFATSLASSGEYAFVFHNSTSNVGNTGAVRISHLVITAASGASGSYGLINTGGISASATSITQEFQQLLWTTTTNAMPATIGFSNLSNNGASVNHMFAYLNA